MSTQTIEINSFIDETHTNGPGKRTAIFMQGCAIRCRGCQNAFMWERDASKTMRIVEVAHTLLQKHLPVSILGGEPFMQPEALDKLVTMLKHFRRHVIIYSGFTLEQLLATQNPHILNVLNTADILVDGPFLQELDNPFIQWRGSENQRPINLTESRADNFATLVLEDWDTATFTITDDGDILGAEGLMSMFFDDTEQAQRCGQVR